MPIGKVASVIVGPVFTSEMFSGFLLEVIKEHSIHLVVPNMDSATVALSNVAGAVTVSKRTQSFQIRRYAARWKTKWRHSSGSWSTKFRSPQVICIRGLSSSDSASARGTR